MLATNFRSPPGDRQSLSRVDPNNGKVDGTFGASCKCLPSKSSGLFPLLAPSRCSKCLQRFSLYAEWSLSNNYPLWRIYWGVSTIAGFPGIPQYKNKENKEKYLALRFWATQYLDPKSQQWLTVGTYRVKLSLTIAFIPVNLRRSLRSIDSDEPMEPR